MQTMDQALAELLKQDTITPAEARRQARNPDTFPG
jgi:Tfp pilus assembly ATPase PilU